MKLTSCAALAVLLATGPAFAGAGAPVPSKPEGGPPSGRPGAVLDEAKCKTAWSLTERQGDILSQDNAAPFIVNFQKLSASAADAGMWTGETHMPGISKQGRQQSNNPPSRWSDPVVLAAIERAFDATWPVIRAHEADNDKARIAELSMMLSHRLVELAADGVTDPQELRRVALETFPLAPPPVMPQKNAPRRFLKAASQGRIRRIYPTQPSSFALVLASCQARA
jgi:hypothetical protein